MVCCAAQWHATPETKQVLSDLAALKASLAQSAAGSGAAADSALDGMRGMGLASPTGRVSDLGELGWNGIMSWDVTGHFARS